MGEELINLLCRDVGKMLHVQRTDRKCRERDGTFLFFALSVVVAYQGVISSLGIIYFFNQQPHSNVYFHNLKYIK